MTKDVLTYYVVKNWPGGLITLSLAASFFVGDLCLLVCWPTAQPPSLPH